MSAFCDLLLQSYKRITLQTKFLSQKYFRGPLVNMLIISELKK